MPGTARSRETECLHGVVEMARVGFGGVAGKSDDATRPQRAQRRVPTPPSLRRPWLVDHAIRAMPCVRLAVKDVGIGKTSEMSKCSMLLRIAGFRDVLRPLLGASGHEEPSVRQKGVSAAEQIPNPSVRRDCTDGLGVAVEQSHLSPHSQVVSSWVMLVPSEEQNLSRWQ